jgi:ligand-binding sensor domain-containing protein
LSLLLAFVFPAAAQNSWFDRPWNTDDGLPDNSISGIAQSPDGFLWVGTPSGLARFDGAHFEIFSPANVPDTGSRAVRVMTLDHLGRLWLGTDRGGIVCIGNHQTQLFSPKDGLPDVTQKMMVEDGDGAIWISYTGSRVGLARIKDGKVTVFNYTNGLPQTGVCWIAADIHKNLWFARGGDIGNVQNGQFNIVCSLS